MVDGLWPEDLVRRAAQEAATLHPEDAIRSQSDAGRRVRGFSEMPWIEAGEAAPETALNHMTVHPRALTAVAPDRGLNSAGPKSGFHSGRLSLSLNPSYSPERTVARLRRSSVNAAFS